MTVSRVVNDDAGVRAATKARVERAIAELAYVPNSAARLLAGSRPRRLAVLYANPSAAFLSEFLLGCVDEARSRDIELMIEQCEPGEAAQPLVERLLKHHADAVLLPPPLCDDDVLMAALHDAGLPVAQVATGRPAAYAQAVMIDDADAAAAITAHLIAQGHRRIGFIVGDLNTRASQLRHDGFLSALRAAGIAEDPALVVAGDFTFRSGLLAAQQLLDLADRPTAIFASNDDMAAAVVSVASRAGLDIPAQLSVCGFDDTPLATSVWPELTTVRQPVSQMAKLATGLLAEARMGSNDDDAPPPTHMRVAYELVVRQSVGPPKHD